MTPSITLDGRPTEVLIEHPRSTARTYQFQVVDPTTGTPLDLTLDAGLVSDIVVMVKVSDDDADSAPLIKKSILTSGVARSTGPGAVLAVNGWFDLEFTDSEVADPDLFPDGAELDIGAKIYPQRMAVLHGTFRIYGETVRS